jgi:hypothetical protein
MSDALLSLISSGGVEVRSFRFADRGLLPLSASLSSSFLGTGKPLKRLTYRGMAAPHLAEARC